MPNDPAPAPAPAAPAPTVPYPATSAEVAALRKIIEDQGEAMRLMSMELVEWAKLRKLIGPIIERNLTTDPKTGQKKFKLFGFEF